MTAFEVLGSALRPASLSLYRIVHKELRLLTRGAAEPPSILDVGGRKSPYTIGVRARVCISDLPRQTAVQNQLNLGITGGIIAQTRRRRSNIADIVFDDMTRTTLPAESFDGVVSVEVLEHVEQDHAFVANVCRVLKRGGWFLMTTANGDFIPNRNPDHKRHYRREQLQTLLAGVFPSVEVRYAVVGSRYHGWGLRSWSPKRPVRTALSMFGNAVNWLESKRPEVAQRARGTHHLVAIARK